MNRLKCCVVGCLSILLIGMETRSDAAEPVRLRVLSYNIHHCEGLDRKLDLERIARVIKAVEPDVVALQEVDQNAKRSESVDQAAELGRLTEMHAVFGANIPLQGGHYGNAILSRHPILQHKNHLLPNVGGGEQRGVIEATIAIPGTEHSFLFFATHLDHRKDDAQRLASADLINGFATARPDLNAVLVGDLNATPESQTIARFESTWHRANTEILPTFPAEKPNRQIDYILISPKSRWNTVEVRVLDEPVASDHRPIFAILELQPASK